MRNPTLLRSRSWRIAVSAALIAVGLIAKVSSPLDTAQRFWQLVDAAAASATWCSRHPLMDCPRRRFTLVQAARQWSRSLSRIEQLAGLWLGASVLRRGASLGWAAGQASLEIF